MNKGYPHIYTGNGKGKTTAAFGLHPIMFAGTGSDVGNEPARCGFLPPSPAGRIRPRAVQSPEHGPELLRDGRRRRNGPGAGRTRPRPPGVECHTDMNPLLLKPNTDKVCQVILNGGSSGTAPPPSFSAPGPNGRRCGARYARAYGPAGGPAITPSCSKAPGASAN